MNRREKIIWAAGFIDGEGCIQISRYQKNGKVIQYHLMLTAHQGSLPSLELLKNLFGGTIKKMSRTHSLGKRDNFVWCCSCSQAGKALQELLPFLLVKKPQAEVGIDFQSRRIHRGKSKLFDPVKDDVQWKELKKLKRI